MTLEKIGETLGITRERTRQIEEKAMKKVKRILAKNNISSVSGFM